MANKLLKPKRGNVANLSNLPIDDGSLIFAYDTDAPSSTVLVDIGERRLGLASYYSSYSDNSGKLDGHNSDYFAPASSLLQFADKTAFVNLDETVDNTIKLTRANGETVQKVIDNVSHSTSATIASSAKISENANALEGSSLQNLIDTINSTSGSGNAFTEIDTAPNNVIKLTRANGGTVEKIINNVANASSATIASTSNLAKNSNALEGSSLAQILEATSSSTEYLPVTGGTLTGSLNINSISSPQLTLNNQGGGDVVLNLNRNANADWRFYSHDNDLRIQTNYTTSKENFYDVLTLNHNSGDMVLKGSVTASSFKGMLSREGQSATWASANKGFGVLINQFSYTGWNPILRAKTTNGVWTFGPYDSDTLYLNYTSDQTVASTSNICDKQIKIYPNGDLSNLNVVTASTFSGFLDGVSKDSNALSGSSLSQILDSMNSGSVSADSATRLISTSKSIANNLTIRTGTPTSSGWTQFPIYPISNTLEPDLVSYKGKNLSIIHLDGGTQRHDIVALNEPNDGLIYATATSAGTTASRIERILDSGNYGSLITNLNKQVTFSDGLKAQSNVLMDGGNFSVGSTVTTGNGETSIPNVRIYVNGNVLVINTK